MNPQGNFGNTSPDAMAAIREALNRRGMGDAVPALNQQSQASPTSAPLPPEAQGGMSVPPMGDSMGQPTGELPQVPNSEGNPEAKLIISALRERLKALSEIETSSASPQLPPMM